MTEWIMGWKKIAHYLDCSVRTVQRMANKRLIIVYQTESGGVRADAKELDKHIRDAK
jgi:hypothetical protein